MRCLWLLSLLAGLLQAQSPFHILAVERKGLPPFEVADRIYLLDGGAERGLRPGDRLSVRSVDLRKRLGYLKVLRVEQGRTETAFQPSGSRYPMRGDLAILERLKAVPLAAPVDPAPLPLATSPRPTRDAPPREGLLYFRAGHAELSPVGRQKVAAWVEAWGVAGRWAVQVPAGTTAASPLTRQRAETLAALLQELGVPQVTQEGAARTAPGPHDPAWVRHWD
jgi:hypothetical protein